MGVMMLKFKDYIRELTISPDYQQKGVFNPFYTVTPDVEKVVKKEVKPKKELKFKSVDKPKGTSISDKGKFQFQVFDGDKQLPYSVSLRMKDVIGHYGMKTRKNSTASANVNEYCSLYFAKYPKFTDVETFLNDIGGKTGGTGIHMVVKGKEEEITFDFLKQMINQDETPEKDINIGYQMAKAVRKDLPKKPIKYFWTARGKPGNIAKNNPSDIILQIGKTDYIGYSNKATVGKDVTPKFNTAMHSFYKKLEDKTQYKNIVSLMDKAWNDTSKTVKGKNAKKALSKFKIEREKPSESISKKAFATLAKEFNKDKLNFYKDGFYYGFRNNLINSFGNYLKRPKNLMYFLNTIGLYMYPDSANTTPCPYKLLIGTESGATIKDVASNEEYKEFLLNKDTKNYSGIKYTYDGKSQQFTLNFKYKLLGIDVSIPITSRTRAAGGWAGKSLYINTPGIKVK